MHRNTLTKRAPALFYILRGNSCSLGFNYRRGNTLRNRLRAQPHSCVSTEQFKTNHQITHWCAAAARHGMITSVPLIHHGVGLEKRFHPPLHSISTANYWSASSVTARYFSSSSSLFIHKTSYRPLQTAKQIGKRERAQQQLDAKVRVVPPQSSATTTATNKQSLDNAFLEYRTWTTTSSQPPTLSMVTQLARAFLDNHQPERAVPFLWEELMKYSLEPNKYCFGLLARACAKTGDNTTARKMVHYAINNKNLELLNDLRTCTQLLQALRQSGEIDTAKQLVSVMHELKLQPDSQFYTQLITLYGNVGDLEQARQLHSSLIEHNVELDKFVVASLISMYSRCGSLEEAIAVFHQHLQRFSDEVVVLNAMISGYTQHGRGDKALELFHQIIHDGVPLNNYIYTSVMPACTDLRQAKEIHSSLLAHNVELDRFVVSSLISMYSKCGSLEEAIAVFNQYSQRFNAVTVWTSMISAYVEHEREGEALELFQRMVHNGVRPDAHTYSSVMSICTDLKQAKQLHKSFISHKVELNKFVVSSLITMYSKCGSLEEAIAVFNQFLKQFSHEIVVWTAMISGYAQHGRGDKALELFHQMIRVGIIPNTNTYASVMSSCTDLNQARQLHSSLTAHNVELDRFVVSSLISMYSKCGSLEEATAVFNQYSSRFNNSIEVWNAMISGYAQHGRGDKALELFHQMCQQGVKPNDITIVSVLSGCSHIALVDEALSIFNSMETQFGIKPKTIHSNCIVDILGRVGRLQEAKQFIQTMPNSDAVTWNTLLGAARKFGDIAHAEFAWRRLVELTPDDPTPYVELANVYDHCGESQKARAIHQLRVQRGLKKIPGTSWTTVNGETREFTVDDRRYPDMQEIHRLLHDLYLHIKAAGYRPDFSHIRHDLDQKAKEDHLCFHSEKLAIAWAILKTPPGSEIIVHKNLRVCPDCHTATAYISLVTGRKINVRDANRWHHYSAGKCSCNNFY